RVDPDSLTVGSLRFSWVSSRPCDALSQVPGSTTLPGRAVTSDALSRPKQRAHAREGWQCTHAWPGTSRGPCTALTPCPVSIFPGSTTVAGRARCCPAASEFLRDDAQRPLPSFATAADGNRPAA